ncbi:IclR family transcriptional regulator [Jiangella ureilytica]|uniref:IclR family transcriptional regulator n=1 Tax=Jiangella ureilytica TaxID=2530374 RepID=A0A4R4RWM7_9ACTN|nr:IclR family transcriptional regulator [Jiangella ureilytica]
MAGPGREVPAVARALELLGLFLDGQGPRSVPEMTAALGLPRSTTYELVQTLVARNCLRPTDPTGRRFGLGLRLFELGSAYAEGIDVTEQGQQVADDVVRQCDETVHIAVLDGTEVVYLVKADSPQAVRMVSAVGKRLPAHCTAVGKAMLAGLSDSEVAARYAGPFEWAQMTPHSLAGLDALLAELARVRQRGLAYDDCESNLDVRCVAAAVRDASGKVAAGLSISVPVHRSDRLETALGRYAAVAAEELSARLGHRRFVGRP